MNAFIYANNAFFFIYYFSYPQNRVYLKIYLKAVKQT